MRLTNDIRRNIQDKIMGDVPVIDYAAPMGDMIQKIIYDHMDPRLQAVYDEPQLRQQLENFTAIVKHGNGYGHENVHFYEQPDGNNWRRDRRFYGLKLNRRLEIQIEPEAFAHARKGTLFYKLAKSIIDSGLYEKHVAQAELLNSVRNRVKATLASVGSTQKLFDVLEPEFHHLIPLDDDKKIQLPATAAPFADDLRKLGANLPTVPKAKTKRA